MKIKYRKASLPGAEKKGREAGKVSLSPVGLVRTTSQFQDMEFLSLQDSNPIPTARGIRSRYVNSPTNSAQSI